MSELDEHKHNIPENLYIQLANLLKEKYTSMNSDSSSDITYPDEDEYVKCVRIDYIPRIGNILSKYIERLPYQDYFILVKLSNLDGFNNKLDKIHQRITYKLLFEVLPYQALKELIETNGGYQIGKNKIRTYLDDNYEVFQHLYRKSSKLSKHRDMAYHIIDHTVFDYEYIDVEDFPSIHSNNVVDLNQFFKIIEQEHTSYDRI